MLKASLCYIKHFKKGKTKGEKLILTWFVLQYGAAQDAKRSSDTKNSTTRWQPSQDSLIYPGLYSGTGFDLMKILVS